MQYVKETVQFNGQLVRLSTLYLQGLCENFLFMFLYMDHKLLKQKWFSFKTT